MIPKHANPYLLTDQTAVVSRSALRDSDDELEPEDTADPERAQMLARLENILKRSIADVLPKTVQEGDVTGESSSRKKKRRKVDASKVDGQEDEDDSAGPVAVRELHLR